MTAVHHVVKGLPVVLKRVEDELLSSWISRHAEYYRVSPLAMLRHGDSDAVSLRAADLRLNAEQGARLAHIFHLSPADIRRMTHADVPQSAVRFLTPKPIQICLACAQKNEQRDAPAAILRSSLEGWRITCPVCGSKLVEVDQHKAPCPRVPSTPFAEIWNKALHGQQLFDNAIIQNEWPWASPIHVFRMLLVRRHCSRTELDNGFDHGRTANLLVPGFDETVQQLGIEPPRGGRPIVPLPIRPALLAAVSIVIDQGPPAISALSEATIFGHRLQFEKIVSQMQAEIRARRTVSQLLQF
jgi:hypothetical protein